MLWIGGAAAVALVLAVAAIVTWKNGESTQPAAYEALTDFTDSATAPALSTDGRMVAFIRGGSWFLTRTGQIYVKMLRTARRSA
jgi:hypothetical protein